MRGKKDNGNLNSRPHYPDDYCPRNAPPFNTDASKEEFVSKKSTGKAKTRFFKKKNPAERSASSENLNHACARARFFFLNGALFSSFSNMHTPAPPSLAFWIRSQNTDYVLKNREIGGVSGVPPAEGGVPYTGHRDNPRCNTRYTTDTIPVQYPIQYPIQYR